MRLRLRTWAAVLQSSCTGCHVEQLGRALGVVNPWLAPQGVQSGTRQLHCRAHSSDCSAGASVCSRLAPAAAAAGGGGGGSGSDKCTLSSELMMGGVSSRHGRVVQQRRHLSAAAAVAAEAAGAPRVADDGAAGHGSGTPAGGAAAAAAGVHGQTGIATLQKNTQKRPATDTEQSVISSKAGSGSPEAASTTSSSGLDSSSSSSSVPEVAMEFHALPNLAMDDEEQQSLDKALAVINRLSEAGFMGLIVGGWVRDKFLGRRASDIDIATNATPKQLRRLFPGVVELPRSTVKLSHQGEVLELTCFRGISRAASLFSVAMDAARRDFTLNALYYDPLSRRVLDCLGGVGDATRRTLRLTPDPAARIKEDPLRLLRAVRFATVLGLRLAPETAATLREHAHLCSVQQGLPARRIWLELRKLQRAEQQQPGVWPRALKLCFHLGLLPALLPWLAGNTAAAQQAVLVADRLNGLWAQQQQAVPLGMMVAATVPPSHPHLAEAAQQVQLYFSDPAELESITTLMQAAQLAQQSSRSSGCTSSDEAWVQVYVAQQGAVCLQVLAAWMPQLLADNFTRHHQVRMMQLADRIASHKQQLYAQQDSPQDQAAHGSAGPDAEAGAAAGVQARRRRQQEELQAAIQALVGEQQQEQVETKEGSIG